MNEDQSHKRGLSNSAPKILIVGGYGSVGYRIAKLLAPDFRARITIAGRNLRKAEDLARTLGHDSQARMIDVNDSRSYTAALEDVGLVIMCLDRTDTAFARACVTRGIHYVDITASLEVIERLSPLHDLAAANNAALVLSVGLTPGLTNLLAKACVGDAAKSLQVIDIHLLFGMGDVHGKAAIEWMVDRMHRPFEVRDHRGPRRVFGFQEASMGDFPAPLGSRRTYRFDFSDQHTLPGTLGVPFVSTWSTFNSRSISAYVAFLGRTGVLRWSRRAAIRRVFVWLFGAFHVGSNQFALSVQGRFSGDAEKAAVHWTAKGHAEAHGAAVVAAETARRMLRQPPQGGVFHLDQLFDLEQFQPALAAQEIEVRRHHGPLPAGDTAASPA